MTEQVQAEQATKNTNIALWEDFQSEIKNRADELASQLPSTITRERFINAAIAAVKQTPDILKATPRSLFAAVTKAAQDGLVPDGREGVITVYKNAAQWNPMAYGLRKRAREIDGILVDAQVIHENDQFEWGAGDDPSIVHKIKLGDRGKMIGAYAIFKNAQEGILHREVMDAAQIEMTRGQSFAKDSLMWTKFVTEAWRKTVVRRGFKSVPCSAPLERLITRDDDQFDFTPNSGIAPPPKPELVEPPEPFDAAKFYANLVDQMALADTEETVIVKWDALDVESTLTNHEEWLQKAFDARKLRIADVTEKPFPGDVK